MAKTGDVGHANLERREWAGSSTLPLRATERGDLSHLAADRCEAWTAVKGPPRLGEGHISVLADGVDDDFAPSPIVSFSHAPCPRGPGLAGAGLLNEFVPSDCDPFTPGIS